MGNVTLNTEFNTFYKNVDLAIPKEVINEKLSLDFNNKKKDYSLLAKDSFKLGKSTTSTALSFFRNE